MPHLLSLNRRSFNIEEEEACCWSIVSAESIGGMMDVGNATSAISKTGTLKANKPHETQITLFVGTSLLLLTEATRIHV